MKIRAYQARRVASWLRAALNLQETDVPSNLVTEKVDAGAPFSTIQAMIDAYQNGVGIAELLNVTSEITGPTGAGIAPVEIIPADPAYCYLILAATLFQSGLAADRYVALGTHPIVPFEGAPAPTGLALASLMYDHTKAFIDWKAIAGTADARIYVPPGFNIQWGATDLAGAGEVVAIALSVFKIPAGFKPF